MHFSIIIVTTQYISGSHTHVVHRELLVLVRHGAGFTADVSGFARTWRFDAAHASLASLKQSVAAYECSAGSTYITAPLLRIYGELD